MGPDLLCSAAFDGADFRLTLVGDAGSGVRLLWQSAQLGYPGNTDGCFNDVQLYVLDITGDGTPEAVIPEVFIGASWAPSHLDVFTWQDGRIFHALGVKSDEPVELRDIDGDGSYEVINNHAIGQSLSHAGQPRWTDVFGYRDGTYRIANHRFPARFSQLRAEVRGVLRKYPSDPELLMCLGVAEQILGHPREALRAYTRSRRGYAGELNAETDHRERVRIRGRLSELDNRIHGIQAAPR